MYLYLKENACAFIRTSDMYEREREQFGVIAELKKKRHTKKYRTGEYIEEKGE